MGSYQQQQAGQAQQQQQQQQQPGQAQQQAMGRKGSGGAPIVTATPVEVLGDTEVGWLASVRLGGRWGLGAWAPG